MHNAGASLPGKEIFATDFKKSVLDFIVETLRRLELSGFVALKP